VTGGSAADTIRPKLFELAPSPRLNTSFSLIYVNDIGDITGLYWACDKCVICTFIRSPHTISISLSFAYLAHILFSKIVQSITSHHLSHIPDFDTFT
jgi:hypothetical protein